MTQLGEHESALYVGFHSRDQKAAVQNWIDRCAFCNLDTTLAAACAISRHASSAAQVRAYRSY